MKWVERHIVVKRILADLQFATDDISKIKSCILEASNVLWDRLSDEDIEYLNNREKLGCQLPKV